VLADQASNFNAANATVINRFNGTAYTEAAATVSGGGTMPNPYYAKASGYTVFAPFVVSNTSALPLNLLSFTASKINNAVTVAWTTSNEINIKGFDVERSSDASNFTSIASTVAKNSSGINYYSTIDANMVTVTSYYRLKIINSDGSYQYSNIISINNQQLGALKAYPNPATTSFVLQHPSANSTSTISLYNAHGQLIKSIKVLLMATQTNITIDDIVSGTYMLMFNNGAVHTLRFVKQ
jgi:hypothetical protein